MEKNISEVRYKFFICDVEASNEMILEVANGAFIIILMVKMR